MNTKEVANLTGLSVRTLHHYDEIGLLSPRRNRENGYREYDEGDLDALQQILLFKACGFSLAQIEKILRSPSFDRNAALALQKKTLRHEKRRIETMLDTLEKTMRATKGELTMTQDEKFAGFDMNRNPYEGEARTLWGDEAVDRSNAYIGGLSEEEKGDVSRGLDGLFTRLAAVRGEKPDSPAAQEAIDEMYRHFNENFGYHYSLEAFAGLGRLYVEDARFTKNLDRYGEGLAAFLAEAMGVYASLNEEG